MDDSPISTVSCGIKTNSFNFVESITFSDVLFACIFVITTLSIMELLQPFFMSNTRPLSLRPEHCFVLSRESYKRIVPLLLIH